MDCTTELNNLIAADCANPAIAGLYGEVVLIPFNAIDRVGSTVVDNVISEIALKNGRKGVTFSSFDNSPLGAVSLVAGTYNNTVQHDLTLRIFVKNEDVKSFVNSFLNARIVAITKNKEIGASGKVTYEAYGWDSGLILNTINSDTSFADGVVYELVTGNDETAKEKSLPKTVFNTDVATTEALIASLIIPFGVQLTSIPVGYNMRGKTITFTRNELTPPGVNSSFMARIGATGLFVRITQQPDTGILIDGLDDSLEIQIRNSNAWLVETYTFPDDDDYLVTVNGLYTHEGAGWGFDYVLVS